MKLLSAAVLLLVYAITVHSAETLRVGEKAPVFTLSYATKDTVVKNGFSLGSEVGKNIIILAFYPADWSTGCTTEMCTMRDNFSGLSQLGCDVFGISGDYVWSHREWARHLNLPFALLSDHDHEVAKTYDSYNPGTGYNKRTIYVIDTKGSIAYIDLDYKAGSEASLNKLKAAIASLRKS